MRRPPHLFSFPALTDKYSSLLWLQHPHLSEIIRPQLVHVRLGEAYESFLVRVAHRLYRFGYRLQGEEHEPEDDWD